MKKNIVLTLFALLVLPFSSSALESHESQLNRGIRNSEPSSYLLIKNAGENNAESRDLLKQALHYSPDLPAVYFELAKNSFSFSVDGMLDSFDYLLQGIDAYMRNFWWSFTFAGSLFLSLVLSFMCSAVFIIIIRLPRDLPLLSHDINEDNSKAALLLFLVFLSVFSPFLMLAGVFILLGIYMKKFDRAIVYLFLVFLLLFPLIFKQASFFINTLYSGSLKSIVQVNQSQGNTYALAALGNEKDYKALFSYALALKREGEYEKAIQIYKKLAEQRPDPKVFINIGNCYAGLYNFEEDKRSYLEEAINYYAMAINLKPSASAYYNYSQVSREMFDFKKGDEYFRLALSIDRLAVSGYRSIYGRNPNRFVIDETLDFKELWNYTYDKSEKISSFGMTLLPLLAFPFLALALAAGSLFLNRRFKQKAYNCRRCNTILCAKCEKNLLWGNMCAQCYRSLVKLEEMDSRERVARLLSIYAHQKKRRDIVKLLSFVLPGSAQAYSGKILYGFVFMWPFLFFLSIPLTNMLFSTGSMVFKHSFLSWAAICIAALLYAVSNVITRRRIARGWL